MRKDGKEGSSGLAQTQRAAFIIIIAIKLFVRPFFLPLFHAPNCLMFLSNVNVINVIVCDAICCS